MTNQLITSRLLIDYSMMSLMSSIRHTWKKPCMDVFNNLIFYPFLVDRNNEGLNLEEIKGFKVPPKILEKMKNHMRSKHYCD